MTPAWRARHEKHSVQNEIKKIWDAASGAMPGYSADDPQVPYEHPREWYAVRTRYRYERKVTAYLERKGLETFLPELAEVHHWSDRRKILQMPLFSGYTFVRVDLASPARLAVLQTEGVIGFITFAGEAAPVPARQIHSLRILLARKTPCSLRPFLVEGQRVRIRDGCLRGLEGILEESTEKHLVISIAAIQRSIAIRIEGYEVEPI